MKKTKVVASKLKKMDKKTIPSDYQLNKVEDACNCGDEKCCKGRNIFKTLFFVVLLIVLGYFAFLKISEQNNLNNFKTKVIPDAVKQVIGEQKLDYKIDNVVAVSGIYKFEIVIKSNGAEQKYNSFITQDGKLFFVSGIELQQKAATANTTPDKTTKMTCSDLPKKDAPKMTAFVVANCPYGLQTQRLFKKAITDIGAMAQNLEVRYIGSIENGKIISMHGDKEAQENLKQICLRDEQPGVFMPYLSCYMQEGKTDECNATAGVNTANLKACTDDANRGLKYAAADFALADKFQVSGSPTLLLNGEKVVSEFDFGGRNVKAIKDMLCCSASNKLSYCSANASADNIAVSYSKEDLATTTGGSTSAANCGN
jgi:glutaredoxin